MMKQIEQIDIDEAYAHLEKLNQMTISAWKNWMEKINYKEIKNIFQKSENEKESKDKIIYLNESNKIIPYDSDEIMVKNF